MGSIIQKIIKKSSILIIVLFILVFTFSFILDFNYSPQEINDPIVPDLSSGDMSFSYDWNMTLGNPTPVVYTGIARDASGKLYVAGYRDNFDKAPIGSWNMIDIILQKYDQSGNLIWDKTWGNDDVLDYCYAITLDSENNIYLAGAVWNVVEWDYNMSLMKFDSEGTYQWHVLWGGTDRDYAYGIALDSEENIYIAGHTRSYGAGDYDFCMVKFNNNGVYQWDQTWGTTGADYCSGIKIDSNNNIYIGGDSGGNVILLKYDTLGNLGWSKVWDGGSTDSCNGITLDSFENIYLTGYLDKAGQGNDLFAVKYNSSGNQQWNLTWGGIANDLGKDIVVDSLNNSYVLGQTLSYGSSEGDACLLKINNTGGLAWSITHGEGKPDAGKLVQLDLTGNIWTLIDSEYATLWAKFDNLGVQVWNSTVNNGGRYEGELIHIDSLDNMYIASSFRDYYTEIIDVSVLKYDRNKEQVLNFTWGASGADWCAGLTLDSEGNVLIGGYTSSFGATLFDAFIAKFNKFGTLIWNITWGRR